MSGKKGPRRCPLCAEVVKAEATKCRSCGSTLALVPGMSFKEPAAGKKGAKGPGGEGAWPAPGPGDVGTVGLGAVLGALVGFGVGAWLGPHVLLVMAGAAAGGAAARAVTAGGRSAA